jgi:hypothetical protein
MTDPTNRPPHGNNPTAASEVMAFYPIPDDPDFQPIICQPSDGDAPTLGTPTNRPLWRGLTTSEPLDFSTLPAKRQPGGSLIRQPVRVDYYNGNGHLFLEDHSLEDILHYLISCCSIDDVKELLASMEKQLPEADCAEAGG